MNPQNSSLSPSRLPYHYYTLPVFLLLILGLIDTAYLGYSHYQNYTNISFNSFCALSKAINCDTVSQSPWSLLLGLPLAYWGFFAYLLFLILFLNTISNKHGSINLWNILCVLAILYSAAAVYFGYISATKIKAYCLLCLLSYVISFSLLFYSWIIFRRLCQNSFSTGLIQGFRYIFYSQKLKFVILAFLIVFVSVKVYIPPYWKYSLPSTTARIPSGVTKDGHPWIGADNPTLIINEFADYQCFQCSKMHFFLRRLIAEQPDKIRLIHHQYPMDNEFNSIVVPEKFHVGSGKMALLAIYSMCKQKFWKMSDLLYKLGRDKKNFNIQMISKETDIPTQELAWALQADEIRDILRHDIWQGMKLGITGTPTFLINGKTYSGTIPPEILKNALQ